MQLTSHDYVRIAAVAVVSPRTFARIYSGERSAVTTYARVKAAALQLKFPPPPTAPAGVTLGDSAQGKPVSDCNLFDLKVGELVEILATRLQRSDELNVWIDVRNSQWPWRQLVSAAERGEVDLSRVGRKLLIRKNELDRWLATKRIESHAAREKTAESSMDRSNNVDHLLRAHGYARVREA